MKKSTFRKVRELQHQRNTSLVQDYLRGVDTGKPSPIEIMEKYHIGRARLYQILAKFGIKSSYRKKWVDK